MVWGKFDDKYAEHPKVQAAGEWAAWVNVKAVLWSCKFLTDGFVPEPVALQLAVGPGQKARAVIERLIQPYHGRSGLWEQVDGGYKVHDFLDYNPSKEAIEAERQANRDRASKARQSRRDYASSTGALQPDSGRNSPAVTVTRPVPSQTRPSPSSPPTPSPAPGAPGEMGESGNGGAHLSPETDEEREMYRHLTGMGQAPEFVDAAILHIRKQHAEETQTAQDSTP